MSQYFASSFGNCLCKYNLIEFFAYRLTKTVKWKSLYEWTAYINIDIEL